MKSKLTLSTFTIFGILNAMIGLTIYKNPSKAFEPGVLSLKRSLEVNEEEGRGDKDDCNLKMTVGKKVVCPGGKIKAVASLDWDKGMKGDCDVSDTTWKVINNSGIVKGPDRNQEGKIATFEIKTEEVGEFTVKAKNPCCGSTQKDLEVLPKVTNFEPIDFPKCVECGVNKEDFNIKTKPAGNVDKVQVEIPSQDRGTHTAKAFGCEGGMEAEYTLKGPSDGFFPFKSSLEDPGGEITDSNSTGVFVSDRNRVSITQKKVNVDIIGAPEWKKVKGPQTIKSGETFSYSRTISKTTEFSAGGGITIGIKGFDLGFDLGVKLATTKSLTVTRSVSESCECSKSGCKFRYTAFQQRLKVKKDATVFERTFSRPPPGGDPPSEDKVPFRKDPRESRRESGDLPTQGLLPFEPKIDKKCLSSS